MRRHEHTRTKECLAGVRRRLSRWRKVRGSRGRIPHELWTAAAKAAQVHGAEAVAVELTLDLGRLEQWMRTLQDSEFVAAPEFVELPQLANIAPIAEVAIPAECTLEIEEPSGRRLRISVKGPATTQAFELGQALWRAWP